MENKIKYRVFTHHEHEQTFTEEFNDLRKAIEYCYDTDLGPVGSSQGHAISIWNDKGSIFEINYAGSVEIDIDNCMSATEEFLVRNHGEEFMGNEPVRPFISDEEFSEITPKQARRILTYMEADEECKRPNLRDSKFNFLNNTGKYYYREGDIFVGMDFSPGDDGFCEEFENLAECKAWLREEFEIDELDEWRENNSGLKRNEALKFTGTEIDQVMDIVEGFSAIGKSAGVHLPAQVSVSDDKETLTIRYICGIDHIDITFKKSIVMTAEEVLHEVKATLFDQLAGLFKK